MNQGLDRNSLFLQGSSWPWNMLIQPVERPLVFCRWGGGFSHTIHTVVYAPPCPPLQLLPSFLAFSRVTLLSALTLPTLVHYTINAPLDPYKLGAISLLMAPSWRSLCTSDGDCHHSKVSTTFASSLLYSGGPHVGWHTALTPVSPPCPY